ncbi:MAG TPA: hypothetical protein VK660_06750 [Xanthomonadaceae bacterium]|nr:hypothetical protein [Xanthomonadaceae bacterium]
MWSFGTLARPEEDQLGRTHIEQKFHADLQMQDLLSSEIAIAATREGSGGMKCVPQFITRKKEANSITEFVGLLARPAPKEVDGWTVSQIRCEPQNQMIEFVRVLRVRNWGRCSVRSVHAVLPI